MAAWSTCVVRDGYEVGLWKPIWKWCHMVRSQLSFVVENELRIKFEKDKWCGNTPFNLSFPSLFTFARSKEAWVGNTESKVEGEELEPLFIDFSMIGKWRMWRDFSLGYIRRK